MQGIELVCVCVCVCVHTCVCLGVYRGIYRCMCTHASTHLQLIEGSAPALAAAKDFAALVALMREHPADPVVARAVCEELLNLASGNNDANRTAIREAGAEPVVRAAVNAPDATADTREKGQWLLDKLAEVSVCVECACVYILARSCLPFHKREWLYMHKH